jgi:hypothetical protein
MDERRRSDQAVLDGYGQARSAKVGEKLCPGEAGGCVPRKANDPGHTPVEPAFQSPPAFPSRQQVNAEADLAQNDRVNRDLALVSPQPLNRFGIGRRLGGFVSTLASTR